MPETYPRIRVIDTHTGGEPTRVVVDGGPQLDAASMLERREQFREKFDDWRQAIACEPRGSDWMVGALITPPVERDSLAGVIFFNNVGYLNMCGHGTIGVAVALAHLGRVQTGRHALDTPVGQVWFELLDGGRVRIENVPSYRYDSNVHVQLPGGHSVYGDIAWGGNWFFLCKSDDLSIELKNLAALNERASLLRRLLKEQGITGVGGAEIDHVELFGSALEGDDADARNFVLCPGGAYDRSPCGTGTSAKLACLAADGQLAPGVNWRQASVIGSRFEASYQTIDNGPGCSACGQPLRVRVTLTGSAYVNAVSDLIFDPADPLCMGIPSHG